ncbi:DUF2141 domain-containing protein [Algibacter sp. L4_22]|uniref:DUF2141 domain-containing protein n=1 Tax=Algibacter sp. L4_22 TaxID=2942477 RepID=UPI00201B69FC|nr:DUF2141 domain-containing protein [Algibacter sp. L4_22]MCL5129707.1 DUF2141 domain-containing protein [Algibacter sp. L4_22]
MKTFLFIFVLLFSITFTNAQNTESAKKTQLINVKIDKLPSHDGHVILTLHNEQTFMKGAGLKNIKAEIIDGKVDVQFEGVTPGTYAILVLHDTNDNNKMDFGETGRPKEAFGTSNNSMSFGPPQFANAKFEVTNTDLEMNIIL